MPPTNLHRQVSCERWADLVAPAEQRTTIVSLWWNHLPSLPPPLALRGDDLRVLMGRFLDAMSEALWAQPWDTNHPAFRDTSKSASVIAGWLASLGVGPGWVVTLFSQLATVAIDGLNGPCPDWPSLLDQIASLAMEAYFVVVREKTEDERAKLLSQYTPIVRLNENLPALIAVANPPPETWEDLLDRLLTEAVRTGASRMIVDLSYAALPIRRVLASLQRFAKHKHARPRQVLVIGVSPSDLPPESNLRAISSLAQALADEKNGPSI